MPLPILRLALLLALTGYANSQQLAAGNLLLATAKSRDSDFARSVVLLIHYDAESAIGLMLNKPTTVPMSDVLPEAKGKSVTIYAGGPVSIGIRGLLRSNSPPFFSVISNKPQILKLISGRTPSSSFRIYAGYTGWTARQLQSEIARGLWKVMPASPGTLWPRLAVSQKH